MNKCSLKFLTFMFLFLGLLAGGCRISDFFDIDKTLITHDGKWKIVTLTPNPRFVAKNYNYKAGKNNFQGFEIEALKHRLGPGLEEEISLCPVRAL